MDKLTVISICITAFATAGILVYARFNYKLYEKINQKNEAQHQRFADLFEGYIIATILSGPSSTGHFDTAKTKFLDEYKGKTIIFKKEASHS